MQTLNFSTNCMQLIVICPSVYVVSKYTFDPSSLAFVWIFSYSSKIDSVAVSKSFPLHFKFNTQRVPHCGNCDTMFIISTHIVRILENCRLFTKIFKELMNWNCWSCWNCWSWWTGIIDYILGAVRSKFWRPCTQRILNFEHIYQCCNIDKNCCVSV